MRKALVTGSVAGLTLAMMGSLPAVADDHYASLSVFHAIPGDLEVDVYLDDYVLAEDVVSGDIVSDPEVAPDTYTVAFREAGAETTVAPILEIDVTLGSQENHTVAAHLSADGDPVLSTWENDITDLPVGNGRLSVRHIAQAPGVDVLAGEEVAITNLENAYPGNGEEVLVLPRQSVLVTVVLTGTQDEVVDPETLDIDAGTNSIVYVWGSAESEFGLQFRVIEDITQVGPTFRDVVEGQVFYDEIRWLADTGLSTGTRVGNDHYFYPSRGLSRQAMAAFLYRWVENDGGIDPEWEAPEAPTFSDVPVDHPFYDEIEWLVDAGLAEGYSDGTYRPSVRISRQAMAAFTARLLADDDWEPTVEEPVFSDVDADHPFAWEIQWNYEAGISTGYNDNTFRPSNRISRQATAAFLYRFDSIVNAED